MAMLFHARRGPSPDSIEPKEHPMTSPIPDVREQLVGDMKAVIADAEELLKATTGATGERISAARARAEETLRAARQRLAGLDDAVVDQAKEAARAADEYVREHPWG